MTTKKICNQFIDKAVSPEGYGDIILRTPKQDMLSLEYNFNGANDSKSSMRKTTDFTSDHYKGSSKKVYSDLKTTDWNDFDQQLQRLIQARKGSHVSISYENHISNLDNIIRRGRMSKEDLFNDLNRYKGSNALVKNKEIIIGFPCLIKGNKGWELSIPYIDRTTSDQKVNFKEIAKPKSEEYHDQFDFLNN